MQGFEIMQEKIAINPSGFVYVMRMDGADCE